MIRVCVHLTKAQLAQLRREAKRTALPISELIRRFVDAGFKEGK